MLMLSVVSQTGTEIDNVTLKQTSATIGRNLGNTLVLEDPKRFISGRHSVIDYRAPDYFITDTSINGVFINDSTQPVGNGNRTKLNNGDQLHIGSYTVMVRIVDEQQQNIDLSGGPISNEAFAISDDPFAELDTDSVQGMIDENQLIPDGRSKTDPFNFTDLGRVGSGLKEEDTDNSSEIQQPPAFKEAFPSFRGVNEQQKPATEDDTFDEDWFNDSQKISDSPSKQLFPGQKASINSPAEFAPAFQSDKGVNQHKKPEDPGEPSNVSGLYEMSVAHFLRGAGLENARINESLTPETFYIIGKMMRSSIQGTMDVLVGRTKIKNEMHLDVTKFKSGENNPVKFSVSAEEAIKKLLAAQDAGYLSAEEAIEEAFDDIRAHQFSVIAGMQSALLGVLKRFDPDRLEQRLQKQHPISACIPVHRKAKLWGLFKHLYKDIEREATDNFYRLFGQAFAESYEQQINKLKHSKKDNPL